VDYFRQGSVGKHIKCDGQYIRVCRIVRNLVTVPSFFTRCYVPPSRTSDEAWSEDEACLSRAGPMHDVRGGTSMLCVCEVYNAARRFDREVCIRAREGTREGFGEATCHDI